MGSEGQWPRGQGSVGGEAGAVTTTTARQDSQGLLTPHDHLRPKVSLHSERWASALDQANQNRDYRQNQQNVDESTQGVGADHSQEPEDQQQHGDSPEHWHSFPEAV
jgi:hypothetical protein